MGSRAKPRLPQRRKKKGRPSLLDIQKRSLRLQAAAKSASRSPSRSSSANPYRRFRSKSSTSSSSLRRTFCRSQPPASASSSDDDEEGRGSGPRRRRREKKLNLVLEADEEGEANRRKRRAVADADRDKVGSSSSSNKSLKATDSRQDQVPDTGCTTLLPDHKLLVSILDKLQKKDIHGVFSEPVDSEELPDYHDIVDHPMDFQTVRRKLSSGKYSSLEQFEKDVFLISSNAMCYNEPDTVYFRQARVIHDLAKKNFETLRQECDGNEAEPKPVIRRGRPPNKFKKALKALGDDNEQNTETFSWLSKQKLERADDYSGLFSLKGFREYGKTPQVMDESRRNTYKQPEWSTSAIEHSVHVNFGGPRKFLVPVGINMDHACARSIARFASDLGSVAWVVAARRLDWMLPLGTKFGPGWVGEDDSLAKTPHHSASPDSLPEFNSLPSTMAKPDNGKLIQTTNSPQKKK